ncbi:chymotrypsin-1 [Nasonia vitripennis]|uniref:chymotrypsin n=1 Tax=Nasonia vitripennis TaxID=7425 RepID=A0A7M7ILS4_NASVI|nr:chymotrypsin-1 [Nasonia vitripennis]
MKFGVVACVCLALFVGAFAAPAEKIVGGENADITEFPYQVSLRLRGKGHFCGGSIISERHILTAAHCVDGIITPLLKNRFSVVTGTTTSSGSSGKSHKIKSTHIHEGYLGTDESSYKNDVAVITLAAPIKFDAKQKKINLPTKDVSLGDKVMVSGWGIKKYPSEIVAATLQKASMKLIPSSQCEQFLYPQTLYSTQVCAIQAQKKGVGVCSGDSGGPLAADNEVIGIASWVVPCGKGFPDVYTKVYAFKDWIKNIIDKE